MNISCVCVVQFYALPQNDSTLYYLFVFWCIIKEKCQYFMCAPWAVRTKRVLHRQIIYRWWLRVLPGFFVHSLSRRSSTAPIENAKQCNFLCYYTNNLEILSIYFYDWRKLRAIDDENDREEAEMNRRTTVLFFCISMDAVQQPRAKRYYK